MLAAPLRAIQDVRRLLAEQLPDPRPLAERVARPVSTNVRALDRALPGGGLPRGKLTVWAPAGGAVALLRSACRAVLTGGEWAAWIDGTETLTYGWEPSRDGAASDARPLLVQLSDRMSALRCAELVLRSGAFALVVLETAAGSEPVGSETVRLTRATRDGGSALVVLTDRESMAALRITSRLLPSAVRWQRGPFGPAMPVEVRVEVRARALGWNERAEVTLAVAAYDLRDALDSRPADRRDDRDA